MRALKGSARLRRMKGSGGRKRERKRKRGISNFLISEPNYVEIFVFLSKG